MKPQWLWSPILVATAVYFLTLGHGFVLDDNLVITNHAHVQEGIGGIGKILSTNYAHGHLDFNDGLYRPLSLVTFAIEKSLFDLSPAISHLIQALLYGLLLFLLGRFLQSIMGRHSWTSFWILTLFALHPIHTEVVANLKSRDEILALLFFLASATAYVNAIKSQDQRKLIVAGGLYLMALFSKESAITFLAAYPLLHYFVAPSNWSAYLKKAVVVVIPAILFLGTRSLVLSEMGPTDSGVTGLLQNVLTTSDSLVDRLATAIFVQGWYIFKLFFPVDLSHDYSFAAIPIKSFAEPMVIISLVVIIAALVTAFKGIRKPSWFSFGILFYFITVSVVANVLILIGALMAERFVFTPSLGWSIAIVCGATAIPFLKERKQWLFALMAVSFLVLTVARIPDWESNYTLFAADVDKVPQSARAHYNLGTASNDRAKQFPREAPAMREQAIEHLTEAIEIWPEYQDAYNNLGVVYIDMKRFNDALNVYTRTYEMFPEYRKGLFNLAVTYFRLGRYAEAEAYFETYYSGGNNNDVLFMIAESQGYQGKFDEAIANLEFLISREPTRGRGYLKLGTAYGITGNNELAEVNFLKAVEFSPRNAEAHMNLGLLYLNTGRAVQAKEKFKDALAIDPNLEQAKQLLQSI